MRALTITNSITRRDQRSLEKYLNEISKYEVLSPEAETALFRRFKNGDEAAFSKILRHNLRFVVSVAKQYQYTGLWLGDLVSEGNIGLMKAARRFDETRGFKFISYAVWWIRQSIILAINEKGRKIRLPLNLNSLSSKVREARRSLLQENEREPSIRELAKKTGFSEEKVQVSLDTQKMCRSLDAPVKEGEDVSLAHYLPDSKIESPDYEVVTKESQKQAVRYFLSKLSPRESTVLSLYYGIDRNHPMTLNDIGEMVGITRERVRQVKEKGLRKIRSRYRNQQLVF